MSAALDEALAGLMEALGSLDEANRDSHRLIRGMEEGEVGKYIFEAQYNLCLRAVLMTIPDIDVAGRVVTAFLVSLVDLTRKHDDKPRKH